MTSRPSIAGNAIAMCVTLCVAAALSFDAVCATSELGDETAIACAVRAVADHRSPYECERFLYPPFIANAGAALNRWLELHDILTGLRILNVLGAVFLVWLIAQHCCRRIWERVAVAGTLLILSSNVKESIAMGNPSALVAALGVAALIYWPRNSWLSGVLLGTSLAIKPLFVLVPLGLVVHRSREPFSKRAMVIFACIGTIAILLPPPWDWVFEMLHQPFEHLNAVHNLSLHRALFTLGVHLPVLATTAIICSLMVFVLNSRLWHPFDFLLLSTTASLLAIPVVWSHTLLMGFPVLGATIRKAREALKKGRRGERVIAVAMLATCIWYVQSDTFGDVAELLGPIKGAVLLIAALIPAVLCQFAIEKAKPHAGD